MATALTVEMGEMRLACAADGSLMANGLGACVALCLYDAVVRVAALVQIVLPTAPSLAGRPPLFLPPAQCAHTAVPHVLEALEREGASLARLQAALIGGARIFSFATGSAESLSRLEIGARNAAAVREHLASQGIVLTAEDIGGQCGRNVRLDAGTGSVWVQRIGAEEILLACLASPPATLLIGAAA